MPESLTEKPTTAGWLLLVLPLLLAGGVLGVGLGVADATSQMLPPVTGGGGILILDLLCILIILLAPLGWRQRPGRRVLLDALTWTLYVIGGLVCTLTITSRMLPVQPAWALRAAGAVALFACASFLFYQLCPRGYLALQLALAGVGPFCGWLLGQIVSARTGVMPSYPILYAPSIFSALRSAAKDTAQLYQTTIILYAVATVAMALAIALRKKTVLRTAPRT